MKNLVIIFLSLLSLMGLSGHQQRHIASDKNRIVNGFSADSGYIYEHDLLQKIKFDTIDSLFSYINIDKNDTLGKYYKGNNGHYFSCLNASHGYEGYLLVETLANGTIIAQQPYSVGIHSCCWNKRYDGFKKYGSYISFRSCTTGTGICGGSIDLFKNLKPQSDVGSICESMWTALGYKGNYYQDITSTMQIKNDTVIMRYTCIDYKEKRNKKKIKKTEKFTVRYVDKNSAWTALDSARVIMD